MNDVFRANSIIELLQRLKAEGVPEKDYEEYIRKYFELKAREKLIPLSGSFELTPLCNLDCRMCYVHLLPSQFRPNRLLPAETWKLLIREAYQAGMRRATLTGGECLTYPGFDDVYLALYESGVLPGILTNGTLIDPARLDFFKKYPPDRMQITLYGSSEDAYERVTGHRCFHTVLNNLLAVRDAGIPVKIAITPNGYMADDIDALLETAEKLGIPYFINAHLISPRNNTGRQAEDLPAERYISLYQKQKELKHIELVPADPGELPEENHDAPAACGLSCGAGRSGFGIRYDGQMCPCLSLTDVTADPFRVGFAKAWAQITEAALHYPVPAECVSCPYRKVCLTCAALHKDAVPAGHCDQRICERTKKMAAAGLIKIPGRNAI